MSKAQELYVKAFNVARTPRSKEYKAGALAALKFRLGEMEHLRCPYKCGTAQTDAWLSGAEEGHLIAREHDIDMTVKEMKR